MSLYYLLLLALIQGLTEFLPVSSSGHLAMMPTLTGQDDQGQFIDVAVHIGTLGAVILYFWTDVKSAFFGFFPSNYWRYIQCWRALGHVANHRNNSGDLVRSDAEIDGIG